MQLTMQLATRLAMSLAMQLAMQLAMPLEKKLAMQCAVQLAIHLACARPGHQVRASEGERDGRMVRLTPWDSAARGSAGPQGR